MELTVGAVLEGKVKSITNFGAFAQIIPGIDGLRTRPAWYISRRCPIPMSATSGST